MEELLEFKIGGCYQKFIRNVKTDVIILGRELSPHDFIYHIGLLVYNFHISFCPVHVDLLNDFVFTGNGTINRDAYNESLKYYYDFCNKEEPGYRTYFTSSIDRIFEIIWSMYADLEKKGFIHKFVRDNMICLPSIVPMTSSMLEKSKK